MKGKNFEFDRQNTNCNKIGAQKRWFLPIHRPVNGYILLLGISNVNAQFTYFDWEPTGSNTGTGSSLEYTAIYNLTPLVEFRFVNGATDQFFLDTYGSGEIPRFLLADHASNSGGFNFSAPLRPGSIMILLDVDVSETISFSGNVPVVFLGQIETRAGENSVPPIWNNSIQTLSGPNTTNLEPAAIFDVSGLSQLFIAFFPPFDTEATIAFGVPRLGDVNCDNVVNLLDVAPFVNSIVNGEFDVKADVNVDGTVDLLDVEPFVDLLTN